jgi:hypothetical protein
LPSDASATWCHLGAAKYENPSQNVTPTLKVGFPGLKPGIHVIGRLEAGLELGWHTFGLKSQGG